MELHLIPGTGAKLNELVRGTRRGADELLEEAVDHLVSYNEWFEHKVRNSHTGRRRPSVDRSSRTPVIVPCGSKRAQPLSIWTWSKTVRPFAMSAHLPRFSTHTFRHLRLTDLARAAWDVHEIATFGGHRYVETTMMCIHLSGGELATKLEQASTKN